MNHFIKELGKLILDHFFPFTLHKFIQKIHAKIFHKIENIFILGPFQTPLGPKNWEQDCSLKNKSIWSLHATLTLRTKSKMFWTSTFFETWKCSFRVHFGHKTSEQDFSQRPFKRLCCCCQHYYSVPVLTTNL